MCVCVCASVCSFSLGWLWVVWVLLCCFSTAATALVRTVSFGVACSFLSYNAHIAPELCVVCDCVRVIRRACVSVGTVAEQSGAPARAEAASSAERSPHTAIGKIETAKIIE